MKTADFIVIIHRLYYQGKVKKGGLDQILDYLVAKGKTVLLFEYPLDYSQFGDLKITLLGEGKSEELVKKTLSTKKSTVNWLIETIFSLYYGYKFRSGVKAIITSDPLTTLPAVIMRRMGLFKFHYYHSVDYSTDRFHDKVLNAIYTSLLVFGLKNADLIGVVTKQAKERLGKFNLHNIYYVPNSLDYDSLNNIRLPSEKRDKYSLVVTCSEVSHKYLIHELVELTGLLKASYPDISLRVIGNFDLADSYCKQIADYIKNNNLDHAVTFYGHVDKERNIGILSKCGIGLAFYDGKYSHVIYGDALKIREYCALGLPVVADQHTHTALEMADYGCGFAVNTTAEAIGKITALFDDNGLYEDCSKKSLQWAKENDKRVIMENLLNKYFLKN